jgi:hypothetical protein
LRQETAEAKAERGAIISVGHAPQAFCPGGTRDNSPAIHRWGCPPANAGKSRRRKSGSAEFLSPLAGLALAGCGLRSQR